MPGRRVAIVGTGISGLVCAHRLHPTHDITIYEAADRLGGHTHTVDVDVQNADRSLRIDTGFIVFNPLNYPRFVELIDELGVGWQPTSMSFSVRDERTGIEYNGTSIRSLFAQKSNLVRPSFLRMVRDILRFHREAKRFLAEDGDADLPLGAFLERGRYSRTFIDLYLVPMGSALWSAAPGRVLDFPTLFVLRFFDNHRMLAVGGRPEWRVIRGGSSTYVDALIAPMRDRVRLGDPVSNVARRSDGVAVTSRRGTERFDGVIIATHSDEALAMLDAPTSAERSVLGAIPYQRNEVVLHTDTSILPRRRLAWASWNSFVPTSPRETATVTYDMNILQELASEREWLVSLNATDRLDERRIERTFTVHHPVFTRDAARAQSRRDEINGIDRIWYCGAYWGFGFHEDGVRSALDIVERMRPEPNRGRP